MSRLLIIIIKYKSGKDIRKHKEQKEEERNSHRSFRLLLLNICFYFSQIDFFNVRFFHIFILILNCQ